MSVGNQKKKKVRITNMEKFRPQTTDKGRTYMAELDHSVGVRVNVLLLDVIKALLTEIIQGCFDVSITGRFDVVKTVCQDNSVDHRIHRSLSCAWEQLCGEVKRVIHKEISVVRFVSDFRNGFLSVLDQRVTL